MNTPRPERRRLQFGLRTLLIVVTLACIAMSLLEVTLARVMRQKVAVKVIVEGGGRVHYESCRPFMWPGEEFFLDVEDVFAEDLGEDEAIHLRAFTNLRTLVLAETQITDAGLEHLRGLTNLEMLDLRYTQITDHGLEHVERLTGLTHLDLTCTQITDAGLQRLEALHALTELDLLNTKITDAGLGHLEGLTSLTHVDLRHTQATTHGVESLQRALPNCEILH